MTHGPELPLPVVHTSTCPYTTPCPVCFPGQPNFPTPTQPSRVPHTSYRPLAPLAPQGMLAEMRAARGSAPFGHTQPLTVHWPPYVRVSRVGDEGG